MVWRNQKEKFYMRFKVWMKSRGVGLIVVISSFLYGNQILANPNILKTYEVYDLVDDIFNHKIIGLAFIVFALIKLAGVLKQSQFLKAIGRGGLMFLWVTFLASFIYTVPPNTMWILALLEVFLILSATLGEG